MSWLIESIATHWSSPDDALSQASLKGRKYLSALLLDILQQGSTQTSVHLNVCARAEWICKCFCNKCKTYCKCVDLASCILVRSARALATSALSSFCFLGATLFILVRPWNTNDIIEASSEIFIFAPITSLVLQRPRPNKALVQEKDNRTERGKEEQKATLPSFPKKKKTTNHWILFCFVCFFSLCSTFFAFLRLLRWT